MVKYILDKKIFIIIKIYIDKIDYLYRQKNKFIIFV